MKIMTQTADLLSEQTQAAALAKELKNQQITLLALKNGTQMSAESLARSVQDQGEKCSWIWLPNPSVEDGRNGTAFLCLGRNIQCVDHFSLNKGGREQKQTAHMAIGVQMEGVEDWFYCLSQDPADNFQEQWKQLNSCIVGKRLCGTVWLLGMKPYRQTICPGSWQEAADGEVWYSRKQNIRSYINIKKYNDCSPLSGEGAVVIEVEE